MVEPVSLTVGAIVAALVAKSIDKAEDKAVEGGVGVLGRVVGRLRARFSRDGDEEAAQALSRVEDVPDSPSRIGALAEVLDHRAGADLAFRSDLESLIGEARSAGVDIGAVTQTAWGDQNVQAAGVVNSDIRVNYGQPPPPGA